MRNILPDDKWFEEVDPLLKAYMFEQWLQDQIEAQELQRMNAILVGSFTNPEAARNMLKSDSPDFTSSDEDFQKSIEMIEQDKEKFRIQQKINKRRRRLINKDS